MNDNQYYTILTEAGRRKLRDAITRGEKLHLTEIAVGDGGGEPIRPAEGMTALVNEVYRAPITNNATDQGNPTYAILNLVIPIDVGGWYIREAGVFDSEGELIFIGSLPENYKAVPSMGVASDMSVNLIVDIQQADSVSIVVDPSAVLASREWADAAMERCIEEHDAEPEAHAALVAALIESRDLINDENISRAVDEAIFGAQGRIRQRIYKDLTIYVRTDGDDANDGLTEATARATLDGAGKLLHSVDPGGHRVIIDVGEGRFAGADLRAAINGHLNCFLVGKGIDRTYITSQLSTHGNISHLRMENSTLDIPYGSYLSVSHPQEQAVLAFHGESSDTYQIRVNAGLFTFHNSARLVFSGMTAACMYCQGGGKISSSVSSQIHVEEGTSFTDFLYCTYPGSGIYLSTNKITGSGTGRRYHVRSGAIIHVDYPSLLPGEGQTVVRNDPAGIQGIPSAMAVVNGASARIDSSYNIASVTKVETGRYRVEFQETMASIVYGVQLTPCTDGPSASCTLATGRDRNGCVVVCAEDAAYKDMSFLIQVYD